MKRYIYTAALLLAAVTTLTSCHLEPQEIPAEEMYLRNFIKQFGLIDPEQDWNCAETSQVTVITDGPAQDVHVYLRYGTNLYRVAHYTNVDGKVQIPFDVTRLNLPIVVSIDGKRYDTVKGGTVNAGSTPRSRAGRQEQDIDDSALSNLQWIIAAEDLGTSDDFDFNDIVLGVSLTTVNYTATIGDADWEVVDNDGTIDLTRSTPGSRADGDVTKILSIRALAAGGTLPLYLHFCQPQTDDGGQVVWAQDQILHPDGEPASMEWHKWFTGYYNITDMINTGVRDGAPKGTGKTCTLTVPGTFELSRYCYVDYDNDKASEEYYWYPTKDKIDNLQIYGLYITVKTENVFDDDASAIVPSVRGTAPKMLLIPDISSVTGKGWAWPTERTNITEAYNGFNAWVNDATGGGTWFLTPNAASGDDILVYPR